MQGSLEERFWAKVNVAKENECWEWTGGKSSGRYGTIKFNGKTIRVHRLSWEFHFGIIPDGYCICHKCDNPGCVNPNHLFLGTQRDNVQDMMRKGRFYRGYRTTNKKVSLQEIKEIRIEYAQGHITQRELGHQYGLGQSQIGRIVRGEDWIHVGGPITQRGSGRRAAD